MADLQRLMNAERIGRSVAVTVIHNDGHTETRYVIPSELGTG